MFPIWNTEYRKWLHSVYNLERTESLMIKSFKGGNSSDLAQFYLFGTQGRLPTTILVPLRRKLSIIEAASSVQSLRVPPGNRFEFLQGKELWASIRVNNHWRLLFKWEKGCATEVFLDPHTYEV